MHTGRLKNAVEMRDAGRLEESLRELEAAESVTPDPVERAMVVLNQSAVLARMGRVEEAQARTRRAASLSPAPEVQCNALHSRAAGLAIAGHLDSALVEFERVLREYPGVLRSEAYAFLYEDVQVRRGLLLTQLNRYEAARKVLEECSSFDLSADERWKVLYNLGRCYFNLKDPGRAKQTFLEFLGREDQADPTHVASAHFLLGTIYYNEGAGAKALLEFEWLLPRAEQVGMPTSLLYTWLAKTHRMLRNKPEAERYEAMAKAAHR